MMNGQAKCDDDWRLKSDCLSHCMVVRRLGRSMQENAYLSKRTQVRLGRETATNEAGDAEDACAEERQGCRLGNCRRIGQTDEALLIDCSSSTVAFCDGWRRDPVELADRASW